MVVAAHGGLFADENNRDIYYEHKNTMIRLSLMEEEVIEQMR